MKTAVRMEHVKGRKFTEKNIVKGIQLVNLARASQAKMAHLIDLLYPKSESPQKNTDRLATNKQDVSHSCMQYSLRTGLYMKTQVGRP